MNVRHATPSRSCPASERRSPTTALTRTVLIWLVLACMLQIYWYVRGLGNRWDVGASEGSSMSTSVTPSRAYREEDQRKQEQGQYRAEEHDEERDEEQVPNLKQEQAASSNTQLSPSASPTPSPTNPPIPAQTIPPTLAPTRFSAISEHFTRLPRWMQEYMRWHSDMRAKYPDEDLVTNPDAPKLLVRFCSTPCGGLSDRLAQPEADMYFAYRTNRLWMAWWESPSIQHYLQAPVHTVPDGNNGTTKLVVNWTLPASIQKNTTWQDDPELTLTYSYDQMTNKSKRLDDRLKMAEQYVNNGPRKDEKVFKNEFRSVNHVGAINRQLQRDSQQQLDEDIFHHLFHTLFQPHPRIQQKIDRIRRQQWDNIPAYNAIHWRLRYPKAVAESKRGELLRGKGSNETRKKKVSADIYGLAWEGATKEFAIQQALHALRCVAKHFDTKLPLFVYADSLDLVRYLVQDLAKQKERSTLDDEVWNVTQHMKLLTSLTANDTEVLHIGLQRSESEDEFDPTFIDLFLASQSHCIAYGLGRFGFMASKLMAPEHRRCQLLYQREASGATPGKGDASYVTQCIADDVVAG